MTETFATKLKAMRADLNSIVDRMNRDRSFDAAFKAQQALLAIAALEDADPGWFKDLNWDWQPLEEHDG